LGRDRWATFDCYGTLIDWNGGIRRELARVFGENEADERLDRYHELEPALQAGGERSYRAVMTDAMRELGAPDDEISGLAEALPSWEPFPEVQPSDRRPVRARNRRIRDRVVQARAQALGELLRGDRRGA
jgi:FMN phosphatase YigB (HAD superfamily)